MIEEKKEKVLFDGEVTETVLAQLIANVGVLNTSSAVRNKIKLSLIEMCSNIITHHSGTAHSNIRVDAQPTGATIQVSSYGNANDFSIIKKLLEEVKEQTNFTDYYYNKMAGNTNTNYSSKLGLARVYGLCNGKLSLKNEVVASKVKITFELRIND